LLIPFASWHTFVVVNVVKNNMWPWQFCNNNVFKSTSETETLLPISCLCHLLHKFLWCEAKLKVVVLMGHDPSQITKSSLDKLLLELLDCIVKSLDVCNAVALGLDANKNLQRLTDIVVVALNVTVHLEQLFR